MTDLLRNSKLGSLFSSMTPTLLFEGTPLPVYTSRPLSVHEVVPDRLSTPRSTSCRSVRPEIRLPLPLGTFSDLEVSLYKSFTRKRKTDLIIIDSVVTNKTPFCVSSNELSSPDKPSFSDDFPP